MVDMHPMKKVEIVVDNAAVERVTDLVEEAGAKGYTVHPEVSGKGLRGVRSAADDIYGTFHNAMVVVVTPPETAQRIVEDALELFEAYAGVLYVSDVSVARPEHF